MKNLNILITILILLFSTNCNRDREFFDETPYKVKIDNVVPELIELDENLKAPFHFKEIKRVETPLGGYPSWLKTLRENELILLYINGEKEGHGILFYDNELNLTKRKIIKKGEGPGELTNIPIILGSLSKLYLIDKIKRRLTTFDYDLNILKEKKYKQGPGYIEFFGVALIKEETNILHYFHIGKHSLHRGEKWHKSYAMRTLNVNDCSINILRSEDIINNIKKKIMLGRSNHWTVRNDFIYFVDLKDYIISKMDFNGKVLKKIKIKHKEKKFSQEQLDKWLKQDWGNKPIIKKCSLPNQLYPASFIIKIKEGFAIARREDYSPKEREYITADYFTWDMEFKGKIKLPVFEDCNTVTTSVKAEGVFYYKSPYFYTIKQEEEADFIIKWEIMEGNKEKQ